MLSYLLNSVSKDILAQTVGLEHAANLITTTFASRSKACIANLRGALANNKKESKTADQYVAIMRGFAQELVAVGRTPLKMRSSSPSSSTDWIRSTTPSWHQSTPWILVQ